MSPGVGYQPLSSLNSVGTLLGAGALPFADRATITRQLEEARDAMVRDAALVIDLEPVEALGVRDIYLRLAGRRVLPLSIRSGGFPTMPSSLGLLCLELPDALFQPGGV